AGPMPSLKARGVGEERRKIIADIREETVEWLQKKGFDVIPSEANMIMVDTRRPGGQVVQAMLREKVAIGRAWPSMPKHVRVSIGTREEMAKFRSAFGRVMNVYLEAAGPAGRGTGSLPAPPGRRRGRRRHRRAGRAPLWPGAGAADGAAGGAGPVHVDPVGPDHGAVGPQPGADRRGGHRPPAPHRRRRARP